MESNRNMERAYELLERFDFNELPERDRLYILSVMTEDEYSEMRNTLKYTVGFFSNTAEPSMDESELTSLVAKNKRENNVIKLLKYPVQLYKVAASLLIVLGLYSVFQHSILQERYNLLASHDTVFIHKTDTIYTRLIDTINIIKTKIVFVPQKTDIAASGILLSVARNEYDCKKEICPNEVDQIKKLAYNNNASNDTLLKDFIVSLK